MSYKCIIHLIVYFTFLLVCSCFSSRYYVSCLWMYSSLFSLVIPAKAFAGIMESPAYVCLSVCLSVCYYDNQIKRGRIWTKFFGKVRRGKASPSSFAVAIASRVWRLLSKNAVNRGFFPWTNRCSLTYKLPEALYFQCLSICACVSGQRDILQPACHGLLVLLCFGGFVCECVCQYQCCWVSVSLVMVVFICLMYEFLN